VPQFTHLRMTVSLEQKRVYHRVNTLLKHGTTLFSSLLQIQSKKELFMQKKSELVRNNSIRFLFNIHIFNSFCNLKFFQKLFSKITVLLNFETNQVCNL